MPTILINERYQPGQEPIVSARFPRAPGEMTVIFLNGSYPLPKKSPSLSQKEKDYIINLAKRVSSATYIICADGGVSNFLRLVNSLVGVDEGLHYALTRKIVYVVGDLDSVKLADLFTLARFSTIDVERFDRDKNLTDFQLAIKKVREYEPAMVEAALGGRLDMTVSNIYELFKTPNIARLRIHGNNGEILSTVGAGKTLHLMNVQGQALTLIPFLGCSPFEPSSGLCHSHSHVLPCGMTIKTYLCNEPNVSITLPGNAQLCLVHHAEEVDTNWPTQGIFPYSFDRGSLLRDLLMLLHLRQSPGLILTTKYKEMIHSLIGPGEIILDTREKQVISILPIGDEIPTVKSLGLQWPIDSMPLDAYFNSISNEATGEQVKISIETKGSCLICCNRPPSPEPPPSPSTFQ